MKEISTGPSESQLIRLSADGDARAIRQLYDRYSPRVYAVVRRIAGDDDLAQDYAQEAWIRTIRALPTFRGDALQRGKPLQRARLPEKGPGA